MISFFRKLWKNKRGNAIVIAAATLPMIVGAAGLASDTIQWTLWKRQLQRAADSAAIAGVYDREAASGATTNTATAVSHDISLNLHTWMGLKAGYPQVTYPADAGVMTNQVHVVLQIQQRLPFSSMFMSAAPTITASSTAASIPAGGNACIEALDPTATTGITFSGNAAIYMPDCDAFSNTSGTDSAIARGSSDVTANSVGGVGGIQQSNNFHVTSYRPYSPPLRDPFAGVTPDPSDMHCAVTTTITTTTITVVDTPETGHWVTRGHHQTWVVDTPAVTHNETQSVAAYTPMALTETTDMAHATDRYGNPANCYTSISVSPSGSLTLPAGYSGPLYVNGGNVDFKGDFRCSSCSIVLTNKDAASPIGNITANATANINITAPTTGTYQGIAIYQDRRATDCNNCNKINGSSTSVIIGAIYFPSQELQYNGTGNTTAQCTMFVSRRVTFTGNSGVSNKFKDLADCSAEGLPGNATQRMVRLVG
jgi:Flp pilus assembly protein TadG